MDSIVTGAIAVGAVVVVALVARARSTSEAPSQPGESPLSEGAMPPAPPPAEEPETYEDGDDAEVVAVSSDGYAFVPDVHAVRLVPPHEEGEAWKAGATAHTQRGQQAMLMSWHAGDFTGARVVRGEADEGPWRFEGLGRDGEYTAFAFETRAAAEAALALFESRGVVRLGVHEDGPPVPPSAEQFAEARRISLETEAALDLDDESGD